jgi:hypothetical protein
MRQSEVREVLEAQEGTNMSATVGVNDQDSQILQADLAKVNLLRIRGDFSSAKTLCLSILKRYPESVDAHVMMGDLHSEQAELAPAAEWYSLALDLDPKAPSVAVKLARVQAGLDITKQAVSSRALIQIGKKTSPWLFVAALASALSIGSIAYIAGLKNPPNQSGNYVREKISAPPTNASPQVPILGSGSNSVQLPPVEQKSPPKSDITPVKESPKENKGNIPNGLVSQDQTLFDQIYQKTTYSKNLISILTDPRSQSMIITYSVKEGEHGRYIGAILADVAMEYDTKALQVTVRGVRNGLLSYMADVPKEKIMQLEIESGKDVKDFEDKTWIDSVLTNEYFKDKEITKPIPM